MWKCCALFVEKLWGFSFSLQWAGAFLNYMQKTAVQLLTSTFMVEQVLQPVAHAGSIAQEEH